MPKEVNKNVVCPLFSHNKWDDAYLVLFKRMCETFPEIITEIAGMSAGATAAGRPISILSMFVLALGESVRGCTSVVIPVDNGYLHGHSEEEECRCPLCFAEVVLHDYEGEKKFKSISYPFQLLGSAGGMTENFSFSGNSIDFPSGKQIKKSDLTSDKPVPKTFFTRKFLECSSKINICNLFKQHHSMLPSHFYICFPNSAYSFEIRPVWKDESKAAPEKQLHVNRLTKREGPFYHANHFASDDDQSDKDRWIKWSKKRMGIIKNKTNPEVVRTSAGLLKAMDEFADEINSQEEWKTLAIFVFEISKDKGPTLKYKQYWSDLIDGQRWQHQ